MCCCKAAQFCVFPDMGGLSVSTKKKEKEKHKWKCFTFPNNLMKKLIELSVLFSIYVTIHQSRCLYTLTHTRRAEGDSRAVAAVASQTV